MAVPFGPDAYFADLDTMFEEGFALQPGEYAAAPDGVFLMARLQGQPAGCGVVATRRRRR